MGQVFQAVDRDGRQLAVKLLREDISSQPGLIARFINESEVLRGIDHPNVVKVHDSLVMSASNRPAAMMRSQSGSGSRDSGSTRTRLAEGAHGDRHRHRRTVDVDVQAATLAHELDLPAEPRRTVMRVVAAAELEKMTPSERHEKLHGVHRPRPRSPHA